MATTDATAGIVDPSPWHARAVATALVPIKAFRRAYLPVLMVYFASGALAITAIAESFWVKQALTLSAADLAALGVWLTLPWTIKMVFGELVDTVPIMGSQRRAYVLIGAGLVALGLGLLAAKAAGHLPGLSADGAYRLASFLTVIGVVIQDVVADAMTTEVVPRSNPDGSPREKAEVDYELGMVQVLGRLAIALGGLLVAGLGGYLASVMPYWQVFALALVVPLISAGGAMLVALAPVERRPTDWRILGGGIAFGVAVVAVALANTRWDQEIVLAISLAVVGWMLSRVVGGLEPESRRIIFFAAALIFVYRATPFVGQGYNWFTIDVLGFDERFQGTLAQLSAIFVLGGTWLFANAITRRPIAQVLLWLTVATTLVELPGFGLTLGLHHWTEANLGFGARSIALVDSALTSPFVQLSMIPLLTLVAIYAPAGWRATWFALMASLMSLASMAGGIISKYLNQIWVVSRGDYANLPMLLGMVLLIGFLMPVAAILVLGRRLR